MTNITSLEFDDGEQINVVTTSNYTFITSKYEEQDNGIMLEYTDGSTYRVLVPYTQIDRIYQEL